MRDCRIDFLRFVGLSLIILAHVLPPQFLLNLRCFDVPLMVFVSGLAYSNRELNFSWGFYAHRFARLVFPVWIFLSVYFGVLYMLKLLGIDFGLTLKHVYGSFLLWEGIGYVWIIRVFLLIMLMSPMLVRLNSKMGEEFYFCFLYLILFGGYLLTTHFQIGFTYGIVSEWALYAVGYSFLFLLGLRIKILSKVYTTLLLTVMLLLFVCIAVLEVSDGRIDASVIFYINDYKYPPRGIS